MVYQEDFQVERWMDKYETSVDYNIAETCSYSLSINQVADITGTKPPLEKLTNIRLVYGNIPGSPELRQTVANLVNDMGGDKPVTKDNVLITNGAIGANFLVHYAASGPGDHVIVVDPAYQQLKSVPKMFGAEVSLLTLRPENGYLPELSELKALVKPNTKVITINTPHNPSGAVIPNDMMQQIVQICKDNDCYLHCDEVYRPTFHSCDPTYSAATVFDKAIVTGSASKAFGLAGLRIGWIVTHDQQLLDTCSSRRDYNSICVSMADDLLVSWALSNFKKIVEYNYKLCKENLQILDDFVNSSPAIDYVKPQAGTVAFVRLTTVNDTAQFCHDFITQKRVAVVPGETFGYPGYIRVGFGNSKKDMVEGLGRLKDFMIETGYWRD